MSQKLREKEEIVKEWGVWKDGRHSIFWRQNHPVLSPELRWTRVSNGISFRKKFPWIDSEQFPLFRGRKCSFRGSRKSRFRSSERNGITWKISVLQKILLQQTELEACLRWQNASEQNSDSLLLFLFHRTEFRVASLPWNGFKMKFREFSSIFVPQSRIPSIFLLCGMVWNRIPGVLCSAEQPEFRQNKPTVPYIPPSMEIFFSEIANPNVDGRPLPLNWCSAPWLRAPSPYPPSPPNWRPTQLDFTGKQNNISMSFLKQKINNIMANVFVFSYCYRLM